ncbi:MAG: NADH-quinone oxidoreductase subunit L [Opitutales bacterium]|nr:NADH-quinone oxidoreductase subunit L [Opitutales bacterium]
MAPQQTLLIILLAPLAAASLIALVGRRKGLLSAGISVGSAAVQMLLTLSLLYGSWKGEPITASVEWLHIGALNVNLGFYLTPLAGMLLFVVTFVGFCIHLFAIGYSDDDEARGRFFGGLSIFMFSMTGIVLSSSLFMIFIFWELVGFSSYMLIGHYLARPSAAAAAKKAFIVNRVGDFGFLIGIIWCFWHYGTTDLATLESIMHANPVLLTTGTATAIALCLFCGVLGKSAQMPLHVWLPDAMEGPTPVSALIHAATMVAAGVYLLGRIWFVYSPSALQVVAVVGTVTAAYAAFCAFGVKDIKKILAYSTLSQLGYLVAAFALGTLYAMQHGDHGLTGVGTAHFHLTTHAFFKALMFLGAGSVIHACHHEQDIFKMGGLLKRMPITAVTFLVGVIAISGIPPFSGFYSKDAILFLAQEENKVIFYILAGTAFLTALYMGRLFFIAFLGSPRSEHVEHAKESSFVMWLPLVVLAILSVVGGFEGIYPEAIKSFLSENVLHPHGAAHQQMLILSLCLGLGGLLLSMLLYFKPASRGNDFLESNLPIVFNILKGRLYFDEFYNFYVAKIQQRFACVVSFLEQVFIQRLMVKGSGSLTGVVGTVIRGVHTGNVRSYAFWFLFGLVLFWVFAIIGF